MLFLSKGEARQQEISQREGDRHGNGVDEELWNGEEMAYKGYENILNDKIRQIGDAEFQKLTEAEPFFGKDEKGVQ